MKLMILCIFSMIVTAAAGQTSGKKPPVITPAILTSEIVVDGDLNEAIWSGPGLSGFLQREPDVGDRATEDTEVWIAYDKQCLYIAAKMHDSQPELIDANLARRDSWFDTDRFIVFIDPYFDKSTGYYFGVNAGGAIVDGTLYNDGWDDSSWDGIWYVETRLSDHGWTAEMKIPFTQLRFEEAEEMTWGVNFKRELKRNQEDSFFIMVPRTESGFVSHFAHLVNLKGIHPEQRIELLPYLVQKAQFLDHEDDDPFYKSNQFRTNVGLDAKMSIGSNLNLDLTLNPDFGQVEVDPAVVNLSAFETFYSEKRPFFIEGSDIFQFGFGGSNSFWGFNFGIPEIFYSRRIGRAPQGSVDSDGSVDIPSETDIIGAAKLTGKLNGFSIGALSAVTSRMHARVFENQLEREVEVEPLTHYGVMRALKQFDEGRYGIGMVATTVNRDLRTDALRSELSSAAYVGGLDGWLTLDEENTWVLTGVFTGTHSSGTKDYMVKLQEAPYRYLQRPDREYSTLDSSRTNLNGYYGRVMLNKQSGNFYLNAAVGAASPGLEYHDLGFQFMSDVIASHLVLGYRWEEPWTFTKKGRFYVARYHNINFDGDDIAAGYFSYLHLRFHNFFNYQQNLNYYPKQYNRSASRGGPLVIQQPQFYYSAGLSTDERKNIVGELGWDYWNNEDGSYGWEVEANIEWQPNTQIKFSAGPGFDYNYETTQWIDNFDDPTATRTYGRRYVFGEMLQRTVSANIRLDWLFSPTLSLQMYLQPLISVGDYTRFKELEEPRTSDYHVFEDNGAVISYDETDDEYTIDPDGAGQAEAFTFGNPDFNFKSLRGNIVLRWEALPGSVLYFVWTQQRTNTTHAGDFDPARDFENLINAETDNIFLVKFSYWLDM